VEKLSRFTRRASLHHQLLARKAVESEKPKTFQQKPVRQAVDGDWLCSTIDGEHEWLMSDRDFKELYLPLEFPDWPKPKKKRKRKVSSSAEVSYKRRGKRG
jgi:hypothetical protein